MSVATAVFWKRVTAGAIVLEGALGRGARSQGNAGRHSTRGRRDPDPGRSGASRRLRARVGGSRGAPPVSGYALGDAIASAARVPPLSRRPAVALALVALAAAACGSGGGASPGWSTAPAASSGSGPASSAGASGPSVIPVIIGQQEKGPYRFVFSFLDPEANLPVGSPDRTASVAFIAARRDGAGSGDPGDLRVGDRGVPRRVHRQDGVPRGRRLEGDLHHPGPGLTPGGDRRRSSRSRRSCRPWTSGTRPRPPTRRPRPTSAATSSS